MPLYGVALLLVVFPSVLGIMRVKELQPLHALIHVRWGAVSLGHENGDMSSSLGITVPGKLFYACHYVSTDEVLGAWIPSLFASLNC